MKNIDTLALAEPIFMGDITCRLLSDTELNMQHELARREQWKRTGECAGPTEIGRLDIDPESISQIIKYFGNDYDYFPTEYPERFSPDHSVARIAATREEADFIEDDNIRAQLLDIWQKFNDIVEADMSRLPHNSQFYEYISYFSFGNYSEQAETTHFDTFDDNTIRYAVTVTGPTTIFYKGKFDADCFDIETGDILEDTDIPATAIATSVPQLSVIRFLPGCDPHVPPLPSENTDERFRIFIDKSIVVKQNSQDTIALS